MIKLFFIKFWKPKAVGGILDPTEYLITTRTKQYQGLIVHQNSLVINFCDTRKKHIKILKSNILTIAIVGNLTVETPKLSRFQY